MAIQVENEDLEIPDEWLYNPPDWDIIAEYIALQLRLEPEEENPLR
jgi:hypothetical protein